MSTTTNRLSYASAYAVAEACIDEIADSCVQTVIAGSLRRHEPTAGDVEIVAVPIIELRHERDLFGEVVKTIPVDRLHARLTTLADNEIVRPRVRDDGRLVSWGPAWKALTFDGVRVDLFTPDAGRFGWILALRTGPAAFSRQLVVERGHTTRDGRPGFLPPFIRPADGWLTRSLSGERIETPHERDVFDLFDLPYPQPAERR